MNERIVKPSVSEERGLMLLREMAEMQEDIRILSVGISTAGRAEVEMALNHPSATIYATTVDRVGIEKAVTNVEVAGVSDRVTLALEDVREKSPNQDDSFDFIYARLIFHYLAASELDLALLELYRMLKAGGKLFVVVRAESNIPHDKPVEFSPETMITAIPHYDDAGQVISWERRYFHSPETISSHLRKVGFAVVSLDEYDEELLFGFAGEGGQTYPVDHLIEVVATKTPSTL